MTTTSIDLILDNKETNHTEKLDYDNLPGIIMDLSCPINIRINALEEYYAQKDVGDNAIEIISTLAGMYQLSGTKIIEQFLYRICTHANISSFLKLEAAKSLLEFEEEENGDDKIAERNLIRKKAGFKALDCVCYDLTSTPTPCRIEAIYLLMSADEFQANADSYFREFLRDNSINCEFRYKSILTLENIGAELMRKKLTETEEYNGKKLQDILRLMSYDELRKEIRNKLPNQQHGRDHFICSAQFTFLFHKPNLIYYKTLAGQYLLQKCELNETKRSQIENEILSFAKDKELDYDRRADAADVLLRVGSENMKVYGREIIMELGRVTGENHTIFDNAQNVHTEEVETSVAEALEFLSGLPLYQINKIPINFEYVNEQVETMLKEDREALKIEGTSEKTCKFCESPIIEEFNLLYCSNECYQLSIRQEKIRIAMNRIYMDRALYSKFNNTLSNILLKIWSYLIEHEHEQEMRKRLLEELEEMSGTCSSGFASRLINIISGFGQFNIRISWEDQIIANFAGRLNALARKITHKDSIFYSSRLTDVVELWINLQEREAKFKGEKSIKEEIIDKLRTSEYITETPKIKEVIDAYLNENRDEKIQKCVEDFAEAVLNEMTISSSDYANRQNFALFFRSNLAQIREELYGEFKNLISDSQFDNSMRMSIIRYEGCN